MKTWLLIPDPHAHPHYDNDRFTWLGKHIVKKRHDIVVCIGDWADMPSLSSYDKGKKSFEGRRYKADIEASLDAQEKMFAPLNALQSRQRKNKDKVYKPRLVMTLGNHEDRINRVINDEPQLDGTIGIHDLKYEDAGWELTGFGEIVEIHNWQFTHYFATGVSGRPISGENIAKTLLAKNFMSCVQGHSHIVDYAQRTAANGDKLHGMSIGCYCHPDMIEGWNRNTQRMWWHGVVEMITDDDGRLYSMNMIEQSLLKQQYGK